MDQHGLHGGLSSYQWCRNIARRVPIVLDIYAERDLARGTYTEEQIQERR